MCRLFGLSDGTGLGVSDLDGTRVVDKQAACQHPPFGREAKEREPATFVAHVRYVSTAS